MFHCYTVNVFNGTIGQVVYLCCRHGSAYVSYVPVFLYSWWRMGHELAVHTVNRQTIHLHSTFKTTSIQTRIIRLWRKWKRKVISEEIKSRTSTNEYFLRGWSERILSHFFSNARLVMKAEGDNLKIHQCIPCCNSAQSFLTILRSVTLMLWILTSMLRVSWPEGIYVCMYINQLIYLNKMYL